MNQKVGIQLQFLHLPGCITYGENVEEAISMAKEAIELHIRRTTF
jgi:predicted RNase H-like HicB family nuclease